MVSEDVSAMTFPRTLKQILIGVVWGVLGYLLSMPIGWLLERIGFRGLVGDLVKFVVVLSTAALVLWLVTRKSRN